MSVIKKNHAYFLPSTSDGYFSLFKIVSKKMLLCLLVSFYAVANFAQSNTCDCDYYMYLNDVQGSGSGDGFVHKFRINPNGTFTEIFRNPPTNTVPWFPTGGGLPSPHGLAQDLNGNIYIGEGPFGDGAEDIRKLSCSGTLVPQATFKIDDGGYNFSSRNGIIYVNSAAASNRINAYRICDGSLIGYIRLSGVRNVDGTPQGDPGSPANEDWGFSIAPDGTFYATSGIGDYSGNGKTDRIFRFTPTLADFAAHTLYTSFITSASYPAGITDNQHETFGITSDPAGNMYVIVSDFNTSRRWILKFNSSGVLVDSNSELTSSPTGGFEGARGLAYHAPTNKLYVAGGQDGDCVAIINPATLNYEGPALANVPGQFPKGLAIVKECCPGTTPINVNENACYTGVSQNYFLSDFTSDCDAPLCAGGNAWTPASGNSSNLVFNVCDNSVTVNGPGCGTFTLTNPGVGNACGAFEFTVNLCFNSPPTATVTPQSGTCTGTNPNNDAKINISAATNANQAGFSTGATYSGPAYNGVGTIPVTAGNASITNLMHNTEYTVRIFNGANDCYVDYTVTTPTINCTGVCTIASVTAIPTTCNPNNNQYAVSGQVTFTDAPATGTLTVSISGGGTQVFNAPFTSPINYTINGQTSGGLTETVTATFSVLLSCTNSNTYMAPSGCATTGTCGCTEYIYLNEPEAQKVLKFRVGSNVPLTEIPGQGGGAWYPGSNTSELPFPHGIATDLNGFLYIAETSQDGNIRKLNCDGDIFPVTGTTINDTGVHTNMFSIDNTLYVTGLGGPKAYDLCTGALIGQMCLITPSGNPVTGTPWGLSYNAVTETVYVSGLTGNRIWAFSRAQLEAGIAGTGPCIPPLIEQGPNATVNIGENFTPNAPTGVFGIVGDDSANIYVVESAVVGGTGTYVLKYDVNGLLLATSPVDNVLGGGGYYYGMGMVWSETSNRLYVSNRTNDLTEDCIAAFNASTMAYLGPGAPNPLTGGTSTSGKALGIIKECCPVNLPSSFTREVCGAVGTKFYLNVEAFNDCDGTVCGSSWTPTSLTGMTFDPCDNSVTVTGPGCGIFTLDIGAVTSTSCPAQMSTFTICNLIPSGTVVGNMGTCTGATANNDAKVNLSSVTNADQAGISLGATYTGPSYGGVGTINVSSGSGVFNNLTHNTTYTVRIFNASGTCYVDRTVTTPVVVCCASTVTAAPNACNPNNNQYTVSGQVTVTNGPATGTLTVSITGGSSQVFNAPFASPISYSIGGQTSDGLVKTVTATFSAVPTCGNTMTYTAPANCSPTGTCNCKEYIYLNEPVIGAVLKFEIGAGVPLTEVTGTNGPGHWYPGNGVSELPSPHGLGTDLNGNLYIGSSYDVNTPIRKFNCDGQIAPLSPTTINNQFILTNMFSIGNTIYTTRSGGPAAYNSCTGALIGTMCLNDQNGNPLPNINGTVGSQMNWGLSYNAVTQKVYATGVTSPRQSVWVFTKNQLDAGIAGGACISPLIPLGTTSVINIGDNFLPNNIEDLRGVVSDNAGNIYVTGWYAGNVGFILKYNAAGQFQAATTTSSSYQLTIGIIWSETTNRIYVSNGTDDLNVDCISAFDATTLAYLGTAAPNPNLPDNNAGKAIAIIKECCPVNLPSAFQREVCGAIGTKFYLNQEAFDDCDGTVCGSSWTPTSLNGMTFDPCDNSVTVTGVGCSTFTLGIGSVASTGCGPQNSTFTICNNLPSASFTPLSGTCNAAGPNNDARINVINATYANQAGISAGITYTGPAYGGVGTISLAGGSGTFTGLMHVTAYTIRVFNGSNECYVDFQVNTPSLECCNIAAIVPLNITCYDNGTPGQITDNKIRFNANITNSNALLTSYNVTISGGTTITPNTNVPYGITQFTLGAGTAGSGSTFTITFTDSMTPGCTEVFTITDPGNCVPSVPLCPPVQCGTATIQVNGN